MTIKKIEFKIPGSYIDAIFEQYQNENWKFSIFNPSNEKRTIIKRSIESSAVKEIISKMMTQQFKEDHKQNIEILKKVITGWEKQRSSHPKNLKINKQKNAKI